MHPGRGGVLGGGDRSLRGVDRAGPREAPGQAPVEPGLPARRSGAGQPLLGGGVRPDRQHPLALRAPRAPPDARGGLSHPQARRARHLRQPYAPHRAGLDVSRCHAARRAAGGLPLSAVDRAERGLRDGPQADRPALLGRGGLRARATRGRLYGARDATDLPERRQPAGVGAEGHQGLDVKEPGTLAWKDAAASTPFRGALERLAAVGYGLTYDAIVRGFPPYQMLLDEVAAYVGRSGRTGSPRSAVRVLDVSCGTGTVAARLARDDYAVVALDAVEHLVAVARALRWLVPPATFEMFRQYEPQYLNRDEFERLLARAGFEVLEVRATFLADLSLLAWVRARNVAGAQA